LSLTLDNYCDDISDNINHNNHGNATPSFRCNIGIR